MSDNEIQVMVSDRETTVAKLVEALGALKTGRHNGTEHIGLPAPARRAAAEGLADLGFRFIEAVATKRVAHKPQTWMGAHAAANTEMIDKDTALAAMREFRPDLAEKYEAATTDEQREALLAELRPKVAATLETANALDEVSDQLRAKARHQAHNEREERQRKEREDD
ncbi:Uncharacterised protein [Mycobacteroides abscessus subsp. bolletii]|uniref:Uncharacterized protein n=1 Tax=Mycobacteroides abscessus subsp. bolletii TaxID=319705 RepID=A0A9Q7WJ11_9MYCO|nr:hypothetical protein [Mycobacteroides abscessus]SHT86322.1 Uncharacterised protein [Mycobacteroides abscessus subsp. bolletii]SHU01848.1 Uncharacterised protein [Mycobacteroides abscessus subsp. bolletii]SHX43391.1 Uncharacterised protein [Mycobacteroides abscessus subsp. bolletii]SKM63821.1 Uncharacterised protein [Mycobacteroides abscessus subsp. bolletii]SKN38567.1 Uncharacterised protein [Mycobacteroides abscessus subsp. bolletii]